MTGRDSLRGALWALASAGGFGLIPALARLAYDAGASPMAVVAGQFGLGAAAGAIAAITGPRRYRLGRGAALRTAGVAAAWFLAAISYLGSIATIPVSLAVLILYTFPVLTVLASPLFDRGRIDRISALAALVALAGLALAIGVEATELDGRGLALAGLASLSTAATFLLSRRVVVDDGVVAFNIYLHVFCAALVLAWIAIVGAPALPSTQAGWVPYLGACALYLVAVVMQFGAIRLTGAGRASVAFHAEPLVTIAAAAILLGELLGVRELAGAALVLSAVALSVRAGRPPRLPDEAS